LHKNKKYGSAFPLITIKDMVNVQKRLVDYLGIRNLHAIIGGSMGGMQVLQFISDFPDSAKLAIPIATALKQSPQGIAFHAVGRQAIMRDPNWRKGNYYNGKNQPAHGLSIARMLSHITYMSEDSMWEKFGRKLQDKESLGYNFDLEFQIESYLNYQGESFIKRFDANTYLYITRAIDYFDITRNSSSDEMFVKTKSKCLVVSISSDWLYTTKDALEIVSALRSSNVDTSFVEIKSNFGHDAFLIENPKFEKLIKNFVDNNFEG
jgi:homoserine O-acetyltransferase